MSSSVATTHATDVVNSLKSRSDNSSVILNFQNTDSSKDNTKTVDICITTSEANTMPPTATEQTHAAPKAQVVPFVYFHPASKLTLPYATTNKTNTNNVIVNTVTTPFVTNIANKTQNLSIPATIVNNQGVIFGNSVKTQQIVIQKSSGGVQTLPVVNVPVSSNYTNQKIAGAYFTMLKPVQKTADGSNNRVQMTSLKPTENVHLINGSTTATTLNLHNQKYVLASMPKVTTNRLPTTVTTNSIQPKSISFMPLIPKPVNNNTNQKVFNFKISDGQLQSAVSVRQGNGEQNDKNSATTEVITLEKERDNICDKTYELSIVEDTTSAKNNLGVTISIPDDYDRKDKRDPPKFQKHGISILKKSFNFNENRRQEKSSLIISPIPNSITTISDANTKEVKIASTDLDEEPVTISEAKVTPQRTERRRKSNVSYRRDCEDVEIMSSNWDAKRARRNSFDAAEITFTKLSDSDGSENNVDMKENTEDMVEIEIIKQKSDVNMNTDNEDVAKLLNWEDGIGYLPGSDLKFHMNEFGLLEYITKDEYQKILSKRLAKAKGKEVKKNNLQEDVQCLNCGCYGILSDFINPKYCSFDCKATASKVARDKEAKQKKKKKGFCKNSDGKNEKEHSGSDEDVVSNENSQDKFSYPWTCTKKGFSWSKYLDHIKAKSAPVKLFKDPFPYNRNGFRPGMKLEGVDPQHPSYFCVLSVAEVIGYRLRLHFDGYPDNYDFWVDADSTDIFPAGWCEKYGHVLHPPPGYVLDDFNWNVYLKYTKSSAAPKHLFVNRAGNAICPNGFRVGMKLEAVDKKNTSLVCVATITDMMDNRILVHFDSWDNIYDYWADPTSPYIHPVGWCDKYGHKLTPPNDYPEPELFTWERYLKETKSVPAPVRAFKQRPACGFRKDMRLECVDKRVPLLIRVATVSDVKDHQIRISFDGWPDRYSYWVDDDSPDIHPVGWCQKTGHPIEPPLTPDDVYDFLQCPTVGCRGVGHIKGPKFSKHTNQKYCPYAEENIDLEKVLPDRLLSPDQAPEAVVPVSRDPIEKPTKPRLGRPPKHPKPEPPPPKLEYAEENSEESKPTNPKLKKFFKTESLEIKKEVISSSFDISPPAEKQSWLKHSKYLMDYVKGDVDPREWTEEDVVDFVSRLPNCKEYLKSFKEHRIDGESLLMLSQKDIVDILNIKLGPAIKLYNVIVLLRQNVGRAFT